MTDEKAQDAAAPTPDETPKKAKKPAAKRGRKKQAAPLNGSAAGTTVAANIAAPDIAS